MGLNPFDHMVNTMTTLAQVQLQSKTTFGIKVPIKPDNKKVTLHEYELFLKDFVFEKIKGNSLSRSFIERFGINDSVLNISITDDFAKEYIEQYYVV